MNSPVLIFVAFIVLVQIYLYQARLTESSPDSENLKHVLNKRINGLWGKRSAINSDELDQRILRELYQNALHNQLAHARYFAENDVNPLTLEQFLAQRTIWKDDNENTAENNS